MLYLFCPRIIQGIIIILGEIIIEDQYLYWAIALGMLSAASLPIGSVLGLIWHPNDKITGGLTAFGGGALVAALTLELVAPTTMQLANAESISAYGEASHHLINMLVGATLGGFLFVGLDRVINSKGGFLRKMSTTISYFTSRKAEQRKQIIKRLSVSALIRNFPVEMLDEMVNGINEYSLNAGERLFNEGEKGDAVYFIEDGIISLFQGTEEIATLTSGDVLGEIAVVTGGRRTTAAVAEKNTTLLAIGKNNFDSWRQRSPKFDRAVQTLVADRLEELADKGKLNSDAAQWASKSIAVLRNEAVLPTDKQLYEASNEHGGAPLAIWLGILLDGIPESFVIGAALFISITAAAAQLDNYTISFTAVLPYTLIAGLFLANFPEAMSSSIGMRKQGWGRLKIFCMWFGLTVITSFGAGVGYSLGASVDHASLVLIEGLAAGAMLTMIAAAMIPEAVHLAGSSITGLGTLTGFLVAVTFKFLE